MQRVLTSRSGVLLYLTVWLLLGIVLGGAVSALGDVPMLPAMLFAIPATLLFSVAGGFSAYYMCKANPLRERSPAVIMVSTPLGTALGGPMVATLGGTWTLVASGVATLLLAGAGAIFWREPSQTEWLRGEDSNLRPSD